MMDATLYGPLLMDLAAILLINKTDNDFFFSDLPVIFHNSYFCHVKKFGVRGIQSVGLQVAVPLSPKIGLLFYDPKCYRNKLGDFVEITDARDVDSFNSLQIVYGPNQIFFANEKSLAYISRLHSILKPQISRMKPESEFILRQHHSDGTYSEIYHTYQSGPEFKLELTFLDAIPGVSLDPPVRDPVAVEQLKKVIEKMTHEAISKKLAGQMKSL